MLVGTAAATLFCGQAVAAPKPRLLGSTVATVVSDGGRYVAFMSSEDVMRVYDMRDRSGYSLPTACAPIDGAYGRFLLGCDDGYRLLRAHSRRSRTLRVPEKFRATVFDEMGRHWLSGTQDLDDLINGDFLNWRNGRSVSGYEELEADLDRRRFHRKPSDLGDEYLGSSGGLDLYFRDHSFDDGDDRYTLELRRPGRSRPAVVLRRSRHYFAGSRRLRRGVATWEASGHVGAYVLRTGRTHRWRGSNPEHTRGWIAFLRERRGQSGGRVLYARLPGSGRP